LARIAASMVRGLKFLKDELNIIHRGSFSFVSDIYSKLLIVPWPL
jgi:hypothetical protein